MDVTISFDEVTTLLGCIPTLEPRPNFERIRVLHQHFKQALQRLPCPHSTLHGWKGLVMARELYTLLTLTPFRLPTNPGANAVYVRPIDPNNGSDFVICDGRIHFRWRFFAFDLRSKSKHD